MEYLPTLILLEFTIWDGTIIVIALFVVSSIRSCIKVVKQAETIVIERFGKFDRILIVAHRSDLPELFKTFGNSYEALSKVNLLSFGFGITLGLLLGMVNMLRGGSANTSQRLMRLRAALQFVAILVILGVLWWRSG